MDSLTKKVETFERAYFHQEKANVADDSQSRPTYTGAEATVKYKYAIQEGGELRF